MNLPDESLIILESVDSTNNYAMGLINIGMARAPMTIVAMEQTAGKGRQSKAWESNKGKNITASFIEETTFLPVYRQFILSMTAALACIDFLRLKGLDEVKIKWPNDIYINDRKAGGILIENKIAGTVLKWSVIGIGLNINQKNFSEGIRATSLAALTGKSYDILKLSLDLKCCLHLRMLDLKQKDPQILLAEYNGLLYGAGKVIKFKKDNSTFTSKVISVDLNGTLHTTDAIDRAFEVNEIEWLI